MSSLYSVDVFQIPCLVKVLQQPRNLLKKAQDQLLGERSIYSQMIKWKKVSLILYSE